MKSIYSAILTASVTFTANGILAFDGITTQGGPILTDGDGVKVAFDGPLSFNVALRSQDGVLFDAVLLKNGTPVRYLATGVSILNANAIIADAARGDRFSIQIGLPEGVSSVVIDSSYLFTNFTAAEL